MMLSFGQYITEALTGEEGYLFHCYPDKNWLVLLFHKLKKIVLSSLFPNIVVLHRV